MVKKLQLINTVRPKNVAWKKMKIWSFFDRDAVKIMCYLKYACEYLKFLKCDCLERGIMAHSSDMRHSPIRSRVRISRCQFK